MRALSDLLPNSLNRLILSACARSWRVYQHADFSVRLLCGQRQITLPIFHGCGLHLLKFRDERIQRVIRVLFEQGRRGHFIDIGANQGAMLLNLLDSAADLPYLGFEPDILAAFYLSEIIRRNELTDHWVIPVALSSRQTVSSFYSGAPADVSATISLQSRPVQMYRRKGLVAAARGDDMLKDIDPLFLVKIDVEGSELDALKGMDQMLSTKHPPVYFEVMGYYHLLNRTYSREYFGELPDHEIERLVANRRDNMRLLFDFFSDRGYRIAFCGQKGVDPVDRLDLGPERDAGEMNFLALPAEGFAWALTSIAQPAIKERSR